MFRLFCATYKASIDLQVHDDFEDAKDVLSEFYQNNNLFDDVQRYKTKPTSK